MRRLRFRFMKHTGWENALFVHWPADPAVVAAQLPKGLEPDVLDGCAWVGLVLLTERGVSAHHPVGRRVVPPIDHFGANVRTYVHHNGVPGIFFWSLECSSILASFGARLAGIPYFPARMQRIVDAEPFAQGEGARVASPKNDFASANGGDEFVFDFSSIRTGLTKEGPAVSARWRLGGSSAGSKEDEAEEELFAARARFFVERYSVYASWPLGRGPVLLRGDVQHPPWPVQRATLEALDAEPLLAAAGLPGIAQGPKAQKPHVCFSRGVGPVEFWMLEPA